MSNVLPGEVQTEPPSRPPMIQVVRVTDEIADALAEFFRAVWGDNSTGASVRAGRAASAATNPAFPGEEPPATAYLRDSDVIGYLGTIPVAFWNGSTETPAYWLKGFMVHPDHRNGPVGFAVLKEMLRHLSLSGITTVAPAARRLFTAVGYVDCGVAPNFISALRPAAIARKIDVSAIGLGLPSWLGRAARISQKTGVASLGGSLLGIGLGTWRATRGSAGGLRVDTSGSMPSAAAVDELWTRAKTTFSAAAVRNNAFLSWRYAPGAGKTYEVVSVFDDRAGGRLAALAFVRRPRVDADPRLRGIKLATLSDILFAASDPRAGIAAIAGAERVARRMGADAMLTTASHPAVHAALMRRAAVRVPGNVHLMIRDPGKKNGIDTTLESWWMTRGDASSDEAF